VVGSLAPPSTVSFWYLPRYIRLLEATGLSSVAHQLQWHRLLAMPLLFAAMILVGAAFSLRPQRLGGTMLRVGAGVTTGFLLYFLSDLIFRLGRNDSIPLVLAGWAPAGLTALIGITFLLYLEDG
jgi:lipopolysaccharide export system permease protein